MSFNPGRLRSRVTIQHFAAGEPDAGGGTPGDWETVTRAWAEVTSLEGSEPILALQPLGKVTHRVVMRYRPGVDARMRLKWGVRLLNIRSVVNVEERGELMELICEEER